MVGTVVIRRRHACGDYVEMDTRQLQQGRLRVYFANRPGIRSTFILFEANSILTSRVGIDQLAHLDIAKSLDPDRAGKTFNWMGMSAGRNSAMPAAHSIFSVSATRSR